MEFVTTTSVRLENSWKAQPQTGHKEARCTAKQASSSGRSTKAAMASEDEAPYHLPLEKMYDTDEGEDHSCATTIIRSSVRRGHNSLMRPTEAIFGTGARGSIITNRTLLSDVSYVPPAIFRGLPGDMEVTWTLGGISRVYYNPYAGMSIISASECANNGHSWEYLGDAFHLHTVNKTYIFLLKSGLYIGDIIGYQPIIHKAFASFYTAYIPTTAELEALFSIREVKRGATARKFQATLGFPPDVKLIRALGWYFSQQRCVTRGRGVGYTYVGTEHSGDEGSYSQGSPYSGLTGGYLPQGHIPTDNALRHHVH